MLQFKSVFGKRKRIETLGKTHVIKHVEKNEPTKVIGSKLFLIKDYRSSLPVTEVKEISFTPLNDQKMKSFIDIYQISSKDTIYNTPSDPNLGPFNRDFFCSSCEQNFELCPGHMGKINLNFKIFSPVFRPMVVYVLQSICNSCSKLLIMEDVINDLVKSNGYFRLKNIASLSESAKCQNNCSPNPKFVVSDSSNPRTMNITAKTKQGPYYINVLTVYDIFNSISDDDAKTLGFQYGVHPRDFIISYVPVIPPCMRQSNYRDGKEKLHFATTTYEEVVKTLENMNNSGINDEAIRSSQEQILKRLSNMINSDEKTLKNNEDFQKLITGKKGVVRNNMLGKRVDKTGRTPAGPGIIDFEYVYFPEVIANNITITEKVTIYNILQVEKWASEGMIVRLRKKGSSFAYTSEDLLEVGVEFDRKMIDGDIVLLNRQPTLHRQSMIAAKILRSKNGNMCPHLSVTVGMNLDYDGDELNAHIPQNNQSQLEIKKLSSLSRNIVSTHNSAAITGLVFNAITGAYLISKDSNIPKNYIEYIEKSLNLSSELKDDMKSRLDKLKKVGIVLNENDGKYIFSYSLPEDFWYSSKGVEIRNGIMISGKLSKGVVGAGPNSIVQSISKWYGPTEVARFITFATYITNTYLKLYGLSVGIYDCKSVKPLDISEEIDELNRLNAILTEEEMIQEIQVKTGTINTKVLESVNNTNPIMEMIASGSKGKTTDFAKIVGPLCQQYIRGNRPKKTISNGKRWLSTFSIEDKSIQSRGFCVQGYLEGMDPNGYFAQAQAGRVGVANTALETSQTGDANRKMTLIIEDVVAKEDLSARGPSDEMIHPCFGFATNAQIITERGYNFINMEEFVGRINETVYPSWKTLVKMY
jgi:DNA-directed RNA polymerase beta' subunit